MTEAKRDYQVLLLPGDGVGPEVIAEARATMELVAASGGFGIEFETAHIGGSAYETHGVPVRDEDIELARASDAVLLGAVGGPKWDRLSRQERPEAGLLKLRYELGLFANLRPVRVFDALVDASPLKPEVVRGVDLLIVRELTGGLYFGKPSEVRGAPGNRDAVDTMVYSEAEITRLIELGYRLAAQRRGKLTSVDKANVLSTSQLWRSVVEDLAAKHPDVQTEHQLVDSCAMRLISQPGSFDVLVMENTFGDILSDEASVLAGSLGMLPSASIGAGSGQHGSSGGQFGVYEPIHGSAPDIAGTGRANPIGAILSAAMLLRTSLGREREASAIERAVDETLLAGARTADIAAGGNALSTSEMGDTIRERLRAVLNGA